VTQPRRRLPITAVSGTLLVLLGLVAWALYVKTSGDEPHAYSHRGSPPGYVQVIAGHTYRIAIRGGVDEEVALGLDPASLACTAARPGEAPGALAITYQGADTKATNDIGSFVSRITGQVHVECTGFGPVFVDNAADAAYDWSGLWLVLASLGLLVGGPLVLSALRSAGRGTAESADVDRVDPAAEELL
jgi:hypothetical protein